MICYNNLTMTHPTPIDITNMPDLVRIAEEVEATKTPRELRRFMEAKQNGKKSKRPLEAGMILMRTN